MIYRVILTVDAIEDLENAVKYLLEEKKSKQAAKAVLGDFEQTKKRLESVAGSLQLCENPKLRQLGYRRINFIAHKYFMLYRTEDDTAVIDAIFHSLEDYENKMK